MGDEASADSDPNSNIRSPSDSDLTFKPQSNDSLNCDKEESKEKDCNRYDEGSHSESSMDDEDSSSDLPNGKHHDPVPPDHPESNDKAVTEDINGDANGDAENEDLLKNEKE